MTNGQDRFHGWVWYEHAKDDAIRAWLKGKRQAGISETAAIKEALYLVVSGQVAADPVTVKLDNLTQDVAAIRDMLARGVVVADDGNPPDDDVDDVLAAFNNMAT